MNAGEFMTCIELTLLAAFLEKENVDTLWREGYSAGYRNSTLTASFWCVMSILSVLFSSLVIVCRPVPFQEV